MERQTWTGDLIGKMHNAHVTREDVAKELGYRKSYVSMILNGERNPAGIQARMEAAVDAIIERRKT